jgi:hypothetical protein
MWSKWFFLLGCLLPGGSWAALWVTPQNAGSVSPSVTSGGSLYYFTQPDQPLQSPAFVLFTPLDLNRTLEEDTLLQNVLEVQVHSDLPFQRTAGFTILSVTVSANSSSLPQVPIVSVNGVSCGKEGSGCVFRNWAQGRVDNAWNDNRSGHYYGALLSGGNGSVTIGLNLASICEDASTLISSGVSGCNGSEVIPPGVSPTVIPLNFSIKSYPDQTTPSGASLGTVLDATSRSINFIFQNAAPTFQCPSSALATSYFPGDGRIFLNTSLFSMQPAAGSRAPMQNLIVVGSVVPGVPNTTAAFQKSNSLVSTVQSGASPRSVGGFLNDTPYSLSFLGQDAAGVYAASATPCTIENVRTSAIEGFLRSGAHQCFIATAVFGSSEGFFLDTLRSFRDRILLRYDLTSEWVKWYYRWSPEASWWLMNHMLARWFVLLFLLPVIGFAWMALHQNVFFFFCLGSIFWWLRKKILLRLF